MTEPDKYQIASDFSSLRKYKALDYKKHHMIQFIKIWAHLSYIFTKTQKDIRQKKIVLKTKNQTFTIHHYQNKALMGKRPCLIYFHGGSFVLPAFNYHKKLLSLYAIEAQCDVLLVHYPLSPQYRSDTILSVCWHAIEWVFKYAHLYALNLDKLALGGDSAGGTLAAAMAQKIYDEKGANKIKLQLLILPALDNSCSTDSMQQFTQTPVWHTESSRQMWQAYLASNSSYAIPTSRKNFTGLAPAYIETAEFDPLRDEAVVYAQKLQNAQVPVVLEQTRGTCHGFDAIMHSPITKKYLKQRINALRNAWLE